MVLAIPLLALLYYLLSALRADFKTRDVAIELRASVEQVQRLSEVIHELQIERALSLGYLSSEGTIRKDQLSAQWSLTDKKISESNLALAEEPELKASLLRLTEVRMKVISLSDDNNAFKYYNDLKVDLLDKISISLRDIPQADLREQCENHLSLLYTKDFLAQLRSVLVTSIVDGRFDTKAFAEFASLKGKMEINFKRFKKLNVEPFKSEVNRRLEAPNLKKTLSFLDTCFYHPSRTFAYKELDPFWISASSSIELLKEIEDASVNRITAKSESLISETENKVIITFITAILVFSLIILIVTYIIRGIVTSVSVIREAADRLANGEVDINLALNSQDEIGSLSESFNRMILVTKEYSKTADAIGKGNYDVRVIIRGEADTLGHALERMRLNLEHLSKVNSERNWLLTGHRELSDKIRGEKEVERLANEIITFLCQYMDAKVGVIYTYYRSHFKLSGSYALSSGSNIGQSLNLGEGLAGQVALDKKCLVFKNIPDNYIKINSALGDTSPKDIVVFPFLYEDAVKAVVEIGVSADVTGLQLEFLELVSENIAIAVQSAYSRTEMINLLEETQRQAEELEAQQEELRQTNEELHSKSDLLENSERLLKLQQEELQQSNEELEAKAVILEEQRDLLESAKDDIEKKAREIEQSSRYKSEFLANMSHELRTPLNSILILSQLLADNKSGHLNEKDISFARNIHNSGNDLLNLINEILDLSKVEAGKLELNMEHVKIESVKDDLLAMFTELAGSKGISFSIQHHGAAMELHTDRQRLNQVLRNLLSNAFKFTSKQGSVDLVIRDENASKQYKSERLNQAGRVISFTVIDTGIGIPASKQEIIFEAFQQADGSDKRKYGGTGLGLSISRELATALGGEIHLRSEEGKGSEFTLYLPGIYSQETSSNHVKAHISDTEVIQRQELVDVNERLDGIKLTARDDRYSLNAGDKVILIMEDDVEFAFGLLEFVREKSYKGVVVHDGAAGLSFARFHKPDAILLDIKMPVMDGVEVLRHLKNDPQLRHIPVQIISGYDRRKQGLELGAFSFLNKPVSTEQLEEAFQKINAFTGRKNKKLLVIEDNESQSQAILELIGNNDVESIAAYSGKEALEKLSVDDFDCVILDLGLPDMSGFELLEKIKSVSQKMPVIVYTGKDLSKEENSLLMKLADTIVLKTVSSKERLLDETTLFLHRVENGLPKEKQRIIRKLHKTDEVLKNKTVLVVDDDIRNIYSLTNALEEEGLTCLTAENGKVAIQVLVENPGIDLILMDVMMPEMDGFEATKAIRSMQQFTKLPIIALTAKAMKGDREKCLENAMSDYLSKPVNMDQLLSLMRVWLYK